MTDGDTHLADTIIYGTGFAATELLAPITMTGREGVTLAEAWADGAEAYLGMTIPAFPNFFILYGPNTNHGAGSVIATHEAQMPYIDDALRLLAAVPPAVLEVRREAHVRFWPRWPADPEDGLGQRLLELVRQRGRPRDEQLARLHRRVPRPRRAAERADFHEQLPAPV